MNTTRVRSAVVDSDPGEVYCGSFKMFNTDLDKRMTGLKKQAKSGHVEERFLHR